MLDGELVEQCYILYQGGDVVYADSFPFHVTCLSVGHDMFGLQIILGPTCDCNLPSESPTSGRQ